MPAARIISPAKSFVLLSLLQAVLLGSCYYDNEESLYPGPINCDTLNVTYTLTIVPILEANCTNCHNQQIPSGQVILDNYTDLYKSVENGSFEGTVNHYSGFPPMPQNRGKLSDCKLSKINIWLRDGAADN